MGKFIIDDSFWELFPESKIGVVLIKNMDNTKNIEELKSMLSVANEEAKKFITNETFSENHVVKVYREAYQKFKTKKGARCSIEALLKRVEKESYVTNINPMVDIYNIASLKYGLPAGAEDVDTFVGDLKLTITSGNDEFYLINEDENSPTLEGELCYKDECGAVCRCFNWRDGKRTMIKDETKNVFFVMELIDLSMEDNLYNALNLIKDLTIKYLGSSSEIFVLDINNKELKIS